VGFQTHLGLPLIYDEIATALSYLVARGRRTIHTHTSEQHLPIAQIHRTREQEDSPMPHRPHEQENSSLPGRQPGVGGLVAKLPTRSRRSHRRPAVDLEQEEPPSPDHRPGAGGAGIARPPQPQPLLSVACSPCHTVLVVGSTKGKIYMSKKKTKTVDEEEEGKGARVLVVTLIGYCLLLRSQC
jgi:hypothetical protein